MVKFPTRTPDCDFHSPALLDFFLLTLVFVLQQLSLHWGTLIMLLSQFPSNSKQDLPFYCTAYDYFRADSDGFPDHLRDVPWEDIFKLGVSAAASEFCEWVQVGNDVYIPHRQYQVKPHSSPCFQQLVLP